MPAWPREDTQVFAELKCFSLDLERHSKPEFYEYCVAAIMYSGDPITEAVLVFQ